MSMFVRDMPRSYTFVHQHVYATACLTYFERVAGGGASPTLSGVREACPMVEGKIDMAARRQVTNKLRTQYRKAPKGDKSKILDRVVGTTGMGR